MKRRGYLMLALSLIALFFTLEAVTLMQVEAAQRRALQLANQIRAQSLAESGCRYARLQLSNGTWRGPIYQSPDLGGSFRLEIRSLAKGRYQIQSIGRYGSVTSTRMDRFP